MCQFGKFGYCKYKQECKRRHFVEECKDLLSCKIIKSCLKTHLKACKKNFSGHCRFENYCTYKHEKPIPNKEQVQMADKILQLEHILLAMTRKVLSMEKVISKIKKNNKTCKDVRKGAKKIQNINFSQKGGGVNPKVYI